MHALILAGRRGPDDPLAVAAGAPHRALLDVGGVPMLERVVGCLGAAAGIERVCVSIDAPELLERYPGLTAARESGRLELVPNASSPSRSVLAAMDAGAAPPLLVTTADHALLEPAWVEEFAARADESDADAAVGLVARTSLEARFPGARRTYLPFRGESYSGANLFLLRTAAARRVVEFWLRAEQFRKRPWRLVSTFGVGALARFAFRRLDVAGAFALASERIGARIVPLVLAEAEAAVDVDKLEDLALVREIVSKRAAPR